MSHTLLKFCSFVFIAFSFCFSSCFICTAAAATKSLQSCLTLCDPIDGGPRGSPVPGILQARTLEWVAISFSNAWKWKVKVKSLSHVRLLATPWTTAHQALRPWDFPGKSTGVGRHCLLHYLYYLSLSSLTVSSACSYVMLKHASKILISIILLYNTGTSGLFYLLIFLSEICFILSLFTHGFLLSLDILGLI